MTVDSTIQTIPLLNLSLIVIPALLVLLIFYKWSLATGNALYALGRMVGQLLIIGYFLTFLFEIDNGITILLILCVMLVISSWISLNANRQQRWKLFPYVIAAMALSTLTMLFLIILGVLQLQPWYTPQYVIPLAGMLFANTMNSISLCAERLSVEIEREESYEKARNAAFHAAMIPVINSLFAVGLVSIPGMMTGQILSGVSPEIAARYQIMVMLMIFSSSGIATACYLVLTKQLYQTGKQLQ